MMPSFALLSALVTIGALFSFLSYRVLRLPTSIGTMLLSLAAACALIVGGHTIPALQNGAHVLVSGIDFNQAVLHGMLAFLLFAGALQLDLKQLGRERVSVLSLSVFATALSTVIVGVLFRVALHLVGIPIKLTEALLFGALISPTDPIAVMDMLQWVGAPPELKIQLAGESLFQRWGGCGDLCRASGRLYFRVGTPGAALTSHLWGLAPTRSGRWNRIGYGTWLFDLPAYPHGG